MPRKKMTEEERKAFGEKMKNARAKAKLEKAPEAKPEEIIQENPSDLQRQIDELKQILAQSAQVATTTQGLQVSPQGTMVGTFEKYLVDPKNYPDPSPRLMQEPRLARFAFPINYELAWTVSTTSYETIDHIRTMEPRFTLELNFIMRDEDTDEPTNERFTIRRGIFHEDPQDALTIARANGIDVESMGEKQFLDEMRYLKMRDWLLEAFYPPKSTGTKKNRREEVIGNRVVEVFEVSSQNSETIDFSGIKGKVGF